MEAERFLAEYRALFERHSGAVSPLVLNRFLLRVLLVAFLQTKGWFEIDGRRDYLSALYDHWRNNPGGQLFYQRLAMLFFNALDEPRAEARAVLSSQIGTVPHIGGGIFSPEQFEREFIDGKKVAVFPDELYDDLFAMLSRFRFDCRESGAEDVVTPEAMGAVLAAVLGGSSSPLYEDTASHRRAVKRLVSAQLGGLEPPSDTTQLLEFRDGLRGLHVFDGECGTGTYLVAALEELSKLTVRVDKVERSAAKRRVAAENLRGLDQSEMAVQVARFRIALAIVASDDTPQGLPDLRQIVKKGGALATTRSLPPEGPQVEFKASFEWDLRRGQRSQDMRFGSLRTVAAFLNSEGGTLYIGVSDQGVPVGLEGDFALIEDASPCDVFEGRFREFVKNSFDPLPLNSVTLDFQEMEGKVVCVVRVSPSTAVTYLTHKDASGLSVESVYVRDGNRTIELRGRDRDAFVSGRSSLDRLP